MSLLTNLVSYYSFEGNANDSQGINNITPTSVTYNNSYGKIGQGMNFTRGTSFLRSPDNGANPPRALFPTGNVPLSMSVWSNNRNFQATGSGFSSTLVMLGLQNNNSFIAVAKNNGTDTTIAYGSYNGARVKVTPLSLNTWYHFVLTYDGTTISLYKDGSLIDSGSLTITIDNPFNNLMIGSDYFNNASTTYDGYLDEIGIWSRCLTSIEVSQLYNSGNGLAYPLTVASGGKTKNYIANSISI